MLKLPNLFSNNKKWAAAIHQEQPSFFKQLCAQQNPDYLWIGCSDSRVPANEIVGLMPGELFVHRNIGNLVYHTDINCLSVIQYAVDHLKVEHIIVCGHYGCGGVKAAMSANQDTGFVSPWLAQLRALQYRYRSKLNAIESIDQRIDTLCELNVIEQVLNVANTTIVQTAWQRNQPLSIHGWIYGISDGHLHDLQICLTSPADLDWYISRQEIADNRVIG